MTHSFADANPSDKEPVQSIEPTFVTTESDNDGYKILLEEALEYASDLTGRDLGKDNPKAQEVALRVLQAKQEGKEYLEDGATIGLLEMLLEKYPVNQTRGSNTKRITIRRQVSRTVPAIRGFKAVGLRGTHSSPLKQQGTQKPQVDQTPTAALTTPGNVYKISDISKIDNIRAQIAEDYGEKIAETMASAGAYKAGVEESIKEGRIIATLQGSRLIGGYLKFVVSEEEVYFRVSTLPKGRYQVSDFSKIANIRAQIAEDYSEKIAETMASAGAYKAGVEESIKEGRTAVVLQGDTITGGHLKFIIVGAGVVQHGIVQHNKKE